MKTSMSRSIFITLILTSLAGCAGMTQRQQNTAIGAAIGGVAGSILTNGSGIGTVGGAAIGGVIGHGGR
ncbi:glycine zipper 2TM domain-containing protein [Vogesella sp. LIG4]|uniref:glycine zipper 2TM domain-containing protein n=1 Tax=Vogesella sp. LIG4 TaxID=1192162 RepID=UPI00081F79FB|nr:glycine zipper 2TM domain-containing protein [Vogesella sp. LIG4]SCK22029.1 osmotically inducible lipoprotein OsmB [Vogesella sp. LIG4]